MVTQAVSMNINLGTAGRQMQQDNTDGFSSVLGDISSGAKKQAGFSVSDNRPNFSQAREQRQTGSDFQYTDKASQALGPQKMNDVRPASYDAIGSDNSFTQDMQSNEALSAAEEIISDAAAQAVKDITSGIRRTGVSVSKKEVVSVMISIVKKMKQQTESKDIDDVLNALMAVLDAMAEKGGSMSFEDFKDAFAVPENSMVVTSVSFAVSQTTEEIAMLSSEMFPVYGFDEKIPQDNLLHDNSELARHTDEASAEDGSIKAVKLDASENELPKEGENIKTEQETAEIKEAATEEAIVKEAPDGGQLSAVQQEKHDKTQEIDTVKQEKPEFEEVSARSDEAENKPDKTEIGEMTDMPITDRVAPRPQLKRRRPADEQAETVNAADQKDMPADDKQIHQNIRQDISAQTKQTFAAPVSAKTEDKTVNTAEIELPAVQTEQAVQASQTAVPKELLQPQTDNSSFKDTQVRTDRQNGPLYSDMPEKIDDLTGEAVRSIKEITELVRKELGLSEIKVRSYEPQQQEAIGNTVNFEMSSEKAAGFSARMNGSDRSEELGYILSGGKNGENDSSAPKTQTYDAVHMAAQLIGDRTQAPIPQRTELVPEQQTELRPPEIQAAEQIISRMDDLKAGETEFTMVLNPESLGKITVKMVAAAGGKMAVEISAENPDTARLLTSRTENMQAALRDNGVELERYQVVTQNENTDELMQQNYDGSSKNPYSRRETPEQQEQGGDEVNFYDVLQSI